MSFWKKKTEKWVESPMHNNWYQSSSYFLSSFALITSVSEDGLTSIGPYQLSFPFGVIERREWIVISRRGSNTSKNLLRNKKCALNFVEYDKKHIPNIDKVNENFMCEFLLWGLSSYKKVNLTRTSRGLSFSDSFSDYINGL